MTYTDPDYRREPNTRYRGDGSTPVWTWIAVAVVAILAIGAVLFFALGGDAAVDAEPGSVDVEAPAIDADVDAPNVDVDPGSVDVEPPSVSVDPADAEADAGN